MRRKRLSCVLLSIMIIGMLTQQQVFGWASFESIINTGDNNTHALMTRKAVQKVLTDCPDALRFNEEIIDGTDGMIDDAYGNHKVYGNSFFYEDGNPILIWKDVLKKYKEFDFAGAYKLIGCMLHSVEDAGVPAHAFKISHGVVSDNPNSIIENVFLKAAADHMEDFVQSDPSAFIQDTEEINNLVYQKSEPYIYRDMLYQTVINMVNTNYPPAPKKKIRINDTYAVKTPMDFNISKWSDYWKTGTYGITYDANYTYAVNDKGANPVTVYKKMTDIFPRSLKDAKPEETEFAKALVKESIRFTTASLYQACKNLPPLVKGATIEGSNSPAEEQEKKYNIKMKLMDNISDKVTLKIAIDNKDNFIKLKGMNDKNELEVDLKKTYGKDILYSADFSTVWDGMINGKLVDEGDHNIFITVKDDDDNSNVEEPYQTSFYAEPYFKLSIDKQYTFVKRDNQCTIYANLYNGNIPDGRFAVILNSGSDIEIPKGWLTNVNDVFRNPMFTPQFTAAKDATYSIPFYATNVEAKNDLNMKFDARYDRKGKIYKTSVINAVVSPDEGPTPTSPPSPPGPPPGPGPGGDHPDDNYSVSDTSNYGKYWDVDTDSEIGVLNYGSGKTIGSILSQKGIKTCQVQTDLSIRYSNNKDIRNLKTLIIGSGGLAVLSSGLQRQKLKEFVENGGTILSMSQQYGKDFSALPSSDKPLEGYGWVEDQSCFINAVYYDKDSPIFASQSRKNLTAAFDGYFTEYPKNAQVLLKRTKNDMPSLIEYKVGLGRVIAGTLFTDWAYSHNQVGEEEKHLLDDIILYAISSGTNIRTYKPGDSVQDNLSINYPSEGKNNYGNLQTVDHAEVDIFTSSGDKVFSKKYDITAKKGDIIKAEFRMDNLNKEGIYFASYKLYNKSDEDYIKYSDITTLFAVQKNISDTSVSKADIDFWAVSDKEDINEGDEVEYKVFIRNNTKTDMESLRLGYVDLHSNGNRGDLDNVMDADFSIKSGEIKELSFKRPFYESTRLRFYIYNNKSERVAYFERGIWVEKINDFFARIKVSSDKAQYLPGETATIKLDLDTTENSLDVANPVGDISVTDGFGKKVYENSVEFTSMSELIKNISFKLPDELLGDTFNIHIALRWKNFSSRIIDVADCKLDILGAKPDIVLKYPSETKLNNLAIEVRNESIVAMPSGKLTVRILDHERKEVVSKSYIIDGLEAGAKKLVEFDPDVENAVKGSYILSYELDYGKKITREVSLKNNYKVDFKHPEAYVKGNNTLVFNVSNKGDISTRSSLQVKLVDPHMNEIFNKVIPIEDINLNSEKAVEVNIEIPKLVQGDYLIYYELDYGDYFSGKEVIKNVQKAEIYLEKPDFKPGEIAKGTVLVYNPCDFKLENENLQIRINNLGLTINKQYSVEPHSSKMFDVSWTIPENTAEGRYSIDFPELENTALYQKISSGDAISYLGSPEKIGVMDTNKGVTAAVSDSGKLLLWGDVNNYLQKEASKLQDVKTAKILSNKEALAFLKDGSLRLLLSKDIESLKNEYEDYYNFLKKFETLKNIRCLDEKDGYAVYVKEDGTVACFGHNYNGECDAPEGLKDVVQVATTGRTTLALKSDGTIVSWGDKNNPVYNAPDDLAGVKKIVVNNNWAAALLEDGTIRTWGNTLMIGNVYGDISEKISSISSAGGNSLILLT
ncbi:MAG: hypothetical protein Q8942_12580, partial [Bacillota bacterium]|nr:hypothetical protein [Bacillota bacterium]